MNDKGSVTIFLALTLSAIMLFAACFYDFERTYVMRNKVENGVIASSNSVLAGYNEELIKYGLFATKNDKDVFFEYLGHNLKTSLVKNELLKNKSNVEFRNAITNNAVFKKQINEYMRGRTIKNIAEDIYSAVKDLDFKGATKSEDSEDGDDVKTERHKKEDDESYSELIDRIKGASKTIPDEWLIKPEREEDGEIIVKDETNEYSLEGNMDSFIDKIKTVMDLGLEKENIAGYTLDKFTYWGRKNIKGHYFETAEVEYVVWGNNNQMSNILLAVAEIWAIRFLINSIEEFIKSVDPEPISRILIALADGAITATTDTVKIFGNKKIPLISSFKSFKMGYKDYLKLCMYFRLLLGEEYVIDRIQQLIQNNIVQNDSEFRLDECYTYINVDVKVKYNLYFLNLLGRGTNAEISYKKEMEY